MEDCKHKWEYFRSDSFWRFCGRNNREFHHIDYFFCEHCLEEKTKTKYYSCYDNEMWKLPSWAASITKKVRGYE